MVQWLDEEEQLAWRVVLSASMLLIDRLDRELEQAHELSLSEYEVLAHLSAVPGGHLRMRDLAERALVSKSRLTHVVNRLESAGLVIRRPCPEDRRGLNAVLTAEGRRLLEKAAPTHVDAVRRYLIDCLPLRERAAVVRGLGCVADNLRPEWNAC